MSTVGRLAVCGDPRRAWQGLQLFLARSTDNTA